MQEPIYSLSGILAKEEYVVLVPPLDIAVVVLTKNHVLSLRRLEADDPRPRGIWSLLLYESPAAIDLHRFRVDLLTRPDWIEPLNAMCRSSGPARKECAKRLTALFAERCDEYHGHNMTVDSLEWARGEMDEDEWADSLDITAESTDAELRAAARNIRDRADAQRLYLAGDPFDDLVDLRRYLERTTRYRERGTSVE